MQGLGRAVRACDLARVRTLVDRGADVNAADESGHTPLHIAADGGHLEVARLLAD